MNLYDFSGKKGAEESIVTLLENKNVRIERILSENNVTDWYNQDEDEWVCLLEGESDIEFEDGSVKTMAKGEFIFIPRNQKHRVVRTTKCIWLCVFIGG